MPATGRRPPAQVVGAALAILGGYATLFSAWVWSLRALSDVGEPLAIAKALTVAGPLGLLLGTVLLRRHPAGGR